MIEEIMVIKKDKLFEKRYFEGFLKADKNGKVKGSETNFIETILKNYEFMSRDEVENNLEYKQPIAYGVIINPFTKKIFLYERGSSGYKEKRLRKKVSIGIGGHINEKDCVKNENPIIKSLERELHEEIVLPKIAYLRLEGYINDERDDVGKVHFGIVYSINVDSDKICGRNGEIAYGSMLYFEDVKRILKGKNIEGWSKLLYDFIDEYFKGNEFYLN